jgi:histidinol-phosphate aminotransferase
MSERTVASAAAVGPPPGMEVRLSSNESPFGPSPAALDVLRQQAAEAHRYPDDQSVALREALAGHEGVAPEEVAVGTGSAGLLMDLILHETYRRPDGPDGDDGVGDVLTFANAFIVYRLGAQVAGARYVEAPVGAGYARDPAALLDRVDERTRIVCIDNPGNPTGVHLDGDALRELIAGLPEHVTVAVDEAYHHFAAGERGYATVAELGVDHPRLVVLRTFSKAYALAALRVGYLTGPADLVRSVDTQRVRFNVNAAGQAAAVAALGDVDHLARTVTGTLEGRRRMAAGLDALGVPYVDGLGNFLLIELGEPAAPIVEAYGEHGVGVRPLAPYRMTEQIRVTVGTEDEVTRFLDASEAVLAEVASRR